jgi:hypothetical protein
MDDQPREPRRVPAAIIVVVIVVLALLGLGYRTHRTAVEATLDGLYSGVLSMRLEQPEKYPVEAERFNRCQYLLGMWTALDGPTINLEEVGADLPLPLRLTRTFKIDNPEHLRKRAGEVLQRNLEILSGRKALAPTPTAWRSELAQWRASLNP